MQVRDCEMLSGWVVVIDEKSNLRVYVKPPGFLERIQGITFESKIRKGIDKLKKHTEMLDMINKDI